MRSFEAQCPIDALDEEEDDRLPADQPTHPVQQLAVHHVRLLPRIREHPFEIDLKFITDFSIDATY